MVFYLLWQVISPTWHQEIACGISILTEIWGVCCDFKWHYRALLEVQWEGCMAKGVVELAVLCWWFDKLCTSFYVSAILNAHRSAIRSSSIVNSTLRVVACVTQLQAMSLLCHAPHVLRALLIFLHICLLLLLSENALPFVYTSMWTSCNWKKEKTWSNFVSVKFFKS